jgi:hypothetical protein
MIKLSLSRIGNVLDFSKEKSEGGWMECGLTNGQEGLFTKEKP